jgi:hypothetical protein
MKPAFHAAAVAVIVLCAGACSQGGSGQASAGGGLSETECRAVLGKAREMMDMPADFTSDALEAELRTCADKGTLSQAEYDCGMAATSMPEWAACGIDLD